MKPSVPGNTYAIVGSLLSLDSIIASNIPLGANTLYNSCQHDPNCQFGPTAQYRAFLQSLSTSPCSVPTTFSAPPPTGALGYVFDNASGPESAVDSTITYGPEVTDNSVPTTFNGDDFADIGGGGGGGGEIVRSSIEYDLN